jgi:hypothetical protein
VNEILRREPRKDKGQSKEAEQHHRLGRGLGQKLNERKNRDQFAASVEDVLKDNSRGDCSTKDDEGRGPQGSVGSHIKSPQV